MLKNDFRSLMVEKFGVDPEKPVLLGLSGGPDSLGLLTLLHENGFSVVAAHLDHSLRPGSAVEAIWVKEVCEKLGIVCVIHKMDVQEYSRKRHLSIEEGARMARYTFLFQEAEKRNAQAVLTGHHADDQVETVLMHLIRGSGLSGLAGMRPVLLPNPWSKSIPLVRPLLEFNRQEIEEYLSAIVIEPLTDESNQDTSYFRNRIRHELIPLLSTYNPQIKDRLLKMIDVVVIEDDLVAGLTQKNWDEIVCNKNENFVEFDRQKACALHPALLRRFLRKAINWVDPTLRDVDHLVVERASRFCSHPGQNNRVDLLAGIEMFLYLRDRVVMTKVAEPLLNLWPQVTEDSEVRLRIPGLVLLNDAWLLNCTYDTSFMQSTDPFTCQMDAALLSEDLVISRFNPGDRFKPFSSAAHDLKLGDFWTNEGLPARARSNWPLIRCGDEIVWVPGFRIADRVKVGDSTKSIIRLEMRKK